MKGIMMLVLLVAFISIAFASPCTDFCDATFGASEADLYTGNVTFCGTDGVTYNTFLGSINAFTDPSCYNKYCRVAVVYPGPCGCPNSCNVNIGRGICDAAAKACVCAPGWGGSDCSTVVCSAGNNCTGHGTCVSQSAAKGGDFCRCAEGWTSSDCSVYSPPALAQRVPFGQVFPGQYFANDRYGDNHPVLNISLVSTIRITIAQADLLKMLDPVYTYNQTDLPATAFFYNSYLNDTFPIEMKLRGALSRVYNKKSFNLKFKSNYKKLKGVNLKAANFDKIVVYQMMWEFYRSMMAHTYRMSMVELYINGAYYGLYSMLEKINDDFEESRFNVKDTDMYKIALWEGQYLGNTSAPYQNLLTPIYEVPQLAIEKEEGDDDWSRLIGLAAGLNRSTAAGRSDYLTQHFDVTLYLRSLALDAMTYNWDTYSGTGNNWIIADGSPNNLPYWKWIAFDFDVPLDGSNFFQTLLAGYLYGMTPDQLLLAIENGFQIREDLKYFFLSKNPYKFVKGNTGRKPINEAMFEIPNANKTYTNNMRKFIRTVYLNNGAKLNERWDNFIALATPGIFKDQFQALSGDPAPLFVYRAQLSKKWTNDRFASLLALLGCASTVKWQQTLVSSWTDGPKTYSQWTVTLQVGAEDLFSAEFSVTPSTNNTIQSIWSADAVSTGVYAVPSWAYTNGALPAGSSSYQFGYITSGLVQANFTITNEACSPSENCNASVAAVATNSWEADALYQQYDIQVTNNSPKPIASADVRITLTAGSTLDSTFGLQEVSTNVYRCLTYNLAPSSTSTSGCGYTVKTVGGNIGNTYATTSVDSAICV